MVDYSEIKLMKDCLDVLKELTSPTGQVKFGIGGFMLGLAKGYSELFQQHAGNLLKLLQPYSKANEVKSLKEEYDQVLCQTQVFDQLPKPVFTHTSYRNDAGQKKYFNSKLTVTQSIDNFRYHSKDLISKIEKGKLTPQKPAETEKKTKRWRTRIWTCIKKIPRWIYVLVIFLAALLTCIYIVWWLWTTFWKK